MYKQINNEINDFTDVNNGEKEIMKLWNEHVLYFNYISDCQITEACLTFVKLRGAEIINKKLYGNFVIHMCCLFDFKLISPPDFYSVLQVFQALAAKIGTEIEANKASSKQIKKSGKKFKCGKRLKSTLQKTKCDTIETVDCKSTILDQSFEVKSEPMITVKHEPVEKECDPLYIKSEPPESYKCDEVVMPPLKKVKLQLDRLDISPDQSVKLVKTPRHGKSLRSMNTTPPTQEPSLVSQTWHSQYMMYLTSSKDGVFVSPVQKEVKK